MEEAAEEAEHKGWCDTELSTNEQTRSEKTSAVENLHAQADALNANIAKLTDELTELNNGIAELNKAMKEATELRTEEKEKNGVAVADAVAAQAAVAKAMTVLK